MMMPDGHRTDDLFSGTAADTEADGVCVCVCASAALSAVSCFCSLQSAGFKILKFKIERYEENTSNINSNR